MFGPAKKQTDAPKLNGVDVLIKKLSALPPSIDLIVAAVVGGYSFVAIYIDNSRFIGLICILLALTFALLGMAALSREMKAFKQVESKTSPDALRALKTPEFEKYLMALFSLDGYEVRTAIDDLHRQDDADLIAIPCNTAIVPSVINTASTIYHLATISKMPMINKIMGFSKMNTLSFTFARLNVDICDISI